MIPSGIVSEHPTSSIHAGQAYVTSVTVRENVPELGDLRHDFNFAQRPRRPLLLPVSVAHGAVPARARAHG